MTDVDDVVVLRRSPEAATAVPARPTAALLRGTERFQLGGAAFVIGNTPSANLQVASPTTGHAEVRAAGAGHVVDPAGFAGCLSVNGRLIHEEHALRPGDAIAVGGTVLHYAPADARDALAPITPVDAGRVRSTGAEVSLGRDPSCTVVLDHPTIALQHAVIRTAPGAHELHSLDVSRPVRVNGEPVRRGSIAPGDVLAIGPFRIVFDGTELHGGELGSGLPVTGQALRVTVGDLTILCDVDVAVDPGELVAVIGESGAGKSTLLKALAGVRPVTSGRVLAGGEDVAGRLEDIGYVPQFDTVHGGLTPREALDFAARLRLPADMGEHERHARIDEVLEQLSITERADVRIDRLSGGQRKRVAVAVELLHRPGALFLDEPTTGLDPALERRSMELFRRLAGDGQTVLLVTHATASIELCDRVVIMGRGGHLCFDGPPAEALRHFGVPRFDDLYVLLDKSDPVALAARHRAAGALDRAPAPPRPPAQRIARRRRSACAQARVLTERYALLLRRDAKHLRSSLLQVPVLALITALLFRSDVFARADDLGAGEVVDAGKSAHVLFLIVTIAIWLGSINSAREIVKERDVVRREFGTGVRISSYLASKLAVLTGFVGLQVVLFTAIVLLLRPLHEPLSAYLSLLVVVLAVGALGILLGLLISTTSSSEDQATGVIPLLLVPQLLLGGAIVAVAEMPLVPGVLSSFIPARWGFAAAGGTVSLDARIAEDEVFSQVSGYGERFFELGLPLFLLMVGCFVMALLACVSYALARTPKD